MSPPAVRVHLSYNIGVILDRDIFVRLRRSRDFIAESFGERLRLEDAAREAYLSPFHFHRLFARTFGETPQEFLTRERIEKAKFWLRTTDRSVTEICFEVGYSSLGTFSAKFHRVVGCSPSEYRMRAVRFFHLGRPWTPHFVPMCFMGACSNSKIEEAVRV